MANVGELGLWGHDGGHEQPLGFGAWGLWFMMSCMCSLHSSTWFKVGFRVKKRSGFRGKGVGFVG